jgi:hypothetical protein
MLATSTAADRGTTAALIFTNARLISHLTEKEAAPAAAKNIISGLWASIHNIRGSGAATTYRINISIGSNTSISNNVGNECTHTVTVTDNENHWWLHGYHIHSDTPVSPVTDALKDIMSWPPRVMLIPQVRPAHKYPNSPWEMIHPPGGDNAVCM